MVPANVFLAKTSSARQPPETVVSTRSTWRIWSVIEGTQGRGLVLPSRRIRFGLPFFFPVDPQPVGMYGSRSDVLAMHGVIALENRRDVAAPTAIGPLSQSLNEGRFSVSLLLGI